MLAKNIDLTGKCILVTGAAGFIGANLVMELLRTVRDVRIVGIDNMNDYYDVALKEYRLKQIEEIAAGVTGQFTLIKGSIADKELVNQCFAQYQPGVVVNLAAQAGVRYDNGAEGVLHFVYASSSSVYGSNKKIPYSTEDKVDNPVSLYAATKKSNELLAHAYSKLYGIPSTGLRFFTVYGPAGRPDMAYFGFTNKLVNNQMIQIFNYGNCKRDFTYIDDIVTGITKVMETAPLENEDGVRYKIYNIGNHQPENLLNFVEILQDELKKAKVLPEDYDFEAHKKLVGMQPGDVEVTYADVSQLEQDFGFKPSISLKDGLNKFAKWYYEFYCS